MCYLGTRFASSFPAVQPQTYDMRVLPIATALTAALLTACSSDAVGPPPAPPVDWRAFDVRRAPAPGPVAPTARERAVAEGYAATLSSPGFADLPPRLDAAVHLFSPGVNEARGRDAVVHAHDVLFGAFEPRAFSIDRVWRTDSAQAIEWTLRGQHTHEWMGLAPTRRPVACKGLTLLWTRDDGRIVDIHAYFDAAVVRVQIGALPDGRPLSKTPGHGADITVLGASPPPAQPSSDPPRVFEQTGTPDEARDVSVARAWLDALENGQESVYSSMVTDDVEVTTPELAHPMRGKADLSGYFKAIHKSIGQLDTTIDNAFGVAEYVVLEYSISGEQRGPIGWVPLQRDRLVGLHVVDVIAFDAGRIAHVWRYDNLAEITADSRDL